MSKSMWIDAVNQKPVHETATWSVDVLVWVEDELVPRWGCYHFTSDTWRIKYEGENETYPAFKIRYFAYIDNPYK